MSAQGWQVQLASLLGGLPVYGVWLVGAVLCITARKRRPWGAFLVTLAIGVKVVARVGILVVSPAITSLLGSAGYESLPIQVGVQTLLFAIPDAIAWALLLWAIFGAPEEVARSPVETAPVSPSGRSA